MGPLQDHVHGGVVRQLGQLKVVIEVSIRENISAVVFVEIRQNSKARV